MEKQPKKYNKATLVAAALVITGATAVFGTYASDGKSNQLNARPALTEEQKSGLDQARELFKSGDEEGAKALLDRLGLEQLEWRAHMGEKMKDFISTLTDEQKVTLEEAKKLKEAGDEEGAKTLLDKAGIKLPERPFKIMMSEEVKNALEVGDYDAWKKAVTAQDPNSPLLSGITDEAKFQALVKVHAAMETGDVESAKKIAKEAGLKMPMGHHKGKGMMFLEKDLTDEQKVQLKEARKLMKNGNEEGAKKIFEELALPMPPKFMQKMNLTDEQKAGLEKAKEMRDAGDREGAKALLKSLNIPRPEGKMMRWMDNNDEDSDK